jgi:hypothetical protein
METGKRSGKQKGVELKQKRVPGNRKEKHRSSGKQNGLELKQEGGPGNRKGKDALERKRKRRYRERNQ